MYQKDLESLYLIDSRIVQSVLNIQLERCNFPSTLKRVRVMPMGSAGNRTSNFIERRERERESSLENTLPLSADAVKTWPTSLSRWLAGSECILELENKKELAGETVAESVTRARYSITIRCLHSYCKSLYQIFRKQHFFSALNEPTIHVRFFLFLNFDSNCSPSRFIKNRFVEKNLTEIDNINVFLSKQERAKRETRARVKKTSRFYFNVNEFSAGWWCTPPPGGKKIDEGNPTQEARKTRLDS